MAAADPGGDPSADPSAQAEELIAAQYSGCPQLRPVLDAVLAALPALGPVTVAARKTLVSLSTPRRVFAVVQPTTRSRVDLGLRLEHELEHELQHERPVGRLLAARDLGPATVRIPLARPEDVDAELVGWLRRAYAENAAPPPARRPPRPPAPELGPLTVVIEASSMPGRTWPPLTGEHGNVHIALCVKGVKGVKGKGRPALLVPGKPWLAADAVPGDARSARWEAPVTVRRDADGLDFSGPNVRGDRTDRHLFLAWGDVHDDGTLRLIRGSKIKLTGLNPRIVEEAMRPGHRLVARIRLTGTRGEDPALTWSGGSGEPAEPGAG